ncbi:MAG: TPM domain-containing protein [Bacteroidota bacterium]
MSFFTKNILTKEELTKISETIRLAEQETIGEIRVNIQKRRSFKERNLSLHDLAVKKFFTLGMDKTKEKTGVLIFLLLSDRKFEIIADEGINAKVTQEFWNMLAKKMGEYFNQNKFSDGICYVINEVGAVLKREFPIKPGDENELSDDVVIS